MRISVERLGVVACAVWCSAVSSPALAFTDAEDISNESETVLVGFSKIDATPDYPVRLNGFGFRREESEGVTQRVWVKALAIGEDPKSASVLLTIDNLGVPDWLVQQVAQRLRAKLGLDPSRFTVTFTHSHTTPMLRGASSTIFGTPIPADHQAHIDRYTDQMAAWMEEAATKAIESRAPALLEWGIGDIDFAVNRRTNGGPVDHDLPALFVKDLEGKVRGVYTTYACHCVTLSNNKISGDWAGFVAEAIEAEFPGAIAMVSIGCGADANPSSGVTSDNVEAASLQGRAIASEILRLSKGALRAVVGNPTVRTERIELPLQSTPERQEWEERAKSTDVATANHARVQLAKLDRGEKLWTSVSYPIQSWTFGDDLSMVFLSGEVVVDYALRLKRELDGNRVWIHGYSNDFPFYIPSERILKEGGYEGGDSMIYFDMPSKFEPGLEEKIVGTVRRLVPVAFNAKHNADRTGGTSPLSPERSLACIRTKPNLTVELVVAEPLVVDPVAIDFGPDGKLWVAEMHDYPTGVDGNLKPGGRIKVIEDSNGDGRFDKATVFLDGIPFPTGVLVWRSGVLVCSAPDILYAEDADGDGKADKIEKLYRGFATHNYQARVNSLQPGLDNWVYAATGLFGGNITSATGMQVDLTSRDFRIRPDTGAIEAVTGQTQQSRVRDDWDNWFGCDSGNLVRHYPVVDRYVRRNPFAIPPATAVYVPNYPESNRVYPGADKLVTFKLSGPPGYVTSGCGIGIYRDELLGPEYYGNAFACEPVYQLVHREVLSSNGVTFAGKRADDEQRSEFLTSTDNWFRPVQVRTGPDGAIWIVDMYRFVIEHPMWIPPEVVAKLDVRAGDSMGRIYRVYPSDQPPRPMPRLDTLSPSDLVAAMDSPNGPTRDLVQAMLVWRKDVAAIPRLKELVQVGTRAQVRVQALCTLEGLGAIEEESLLAALNDNHSGVRRQAIRLSEPHLDSSPALASRLSELLDDSDPQVRMQLAYSLGESKGDWAAASLLRIMAKSADDSYVRAAALSSVHSLNARAIVQALIARSADMAPPEGLLEIILAMPAARTDAGLRSDVATLVTRGLAEPTVWRFGVLAQLLDTSDGDVGPILRDRISKLRDDARKIAVQEDAEDGLRIAAIATLGNDDGNDDAKILFELLSAKHSTDLQLAAIRHLSKLGVDIAPREWMARWPTLSPSIRNAVLDALLSRDDWRFELLMGVEQTKISASELVGSQRQSLLDSTDDKQRELAARVFHGPISTNRKGLVERYISLLTPGERSRGQLVFQKNCANCHRLQDIGSAVGPDLAPLANKSASALVTAILDPNLAVDPRYHSYVALTDEGQQYSGLLSEETTTSLTLVGADGKVVKLLRAELDELRSTGKSLMPDGLEKDISPEEMADLIAFLSHVDPPPKHLDGNHPATVTADQKGIFRLAATNAEIRGPQLVFEPELGNLGFWHTDQDYAVWSVDIAVAGRFDVLLDYACSNEVQGNKFCLETPNPKVAIRDKVAGTGQWSDYRKIKVGEVDLPVGRSRFKLRAEGAVQGALFDLRAIYLRPTTK